MSNEPRQCKTCRYWLAVASPGEELVDGECRRYPPVLTSPEYADSQSAWSFPVVGITDVCGEWKRVR